MRRMLLAAILAAASAGPGCKPKADLNNPSFADTRSAVEVYERLEALIDAQVTCLFGQAPG